MLWAAQPTPTSTAQLLSMEFVKTVLKDFTLVLEVNASSSILSAKQATNYQANVSPATRGTPFRTTTASSEQVTQPTEETLTAEELIPMVDAPAAIKATSSVPKTAATDVTLSAKTTLLLRINAQDAMVDIP